MNRKRFIITIATERCKGCELCVAACPKRILVMTTRLNRRGQHYAQVTAMQDCLGCAQCADICPDAAIEIDEETNNHE